jgi:uncharacterized repeat protein (TIGR01451 family)
MSTRVGVWRVDLAGWGLRSAAVAIGLLVVVLFTATAASAQTADLAVTQTAAPNPVAAGLGTPVNVAVTVTNNGPSAANNVAMVYLFPPDTGFAGSGSTPAGWACASGSNSLRCTILTLPASASANFNPTFAAAGQTPAGVVLVADAVITSTTPDPNPANNLATTNTTISPGGVPAALADLAVTKTGRPIVAPGQTITHTITVTNNGPQAAAFPSVTEATPPDMTFVSLVAPAGWTCNTPPVGGVGRVDCVLPNAAGPLASGTTATFTLTMQALAGTPSGTTTSNVVTVDQNVGGNIDPTLTNNRAVLTTLIQLPGDFTGDGFVDIRDYGVWRQNFGQGTCGNPADAEGNCLVDIRDYGIWRLHFGEGTPTDRRGGGPLPAPSRPVPGSAAVLPTEDSGLPLPVLPLVGGLLGLGGLVGWRRQN